MVRIGLHAADADSDRGSGLPEAVQAALAARDSAEPCEIVVTAAMHAGLPKNLQQRCIPVKGSPGGNTLYLVQAGSGQEAAPALSPLLPGGDPAAPLPACCYCGSAGHRAAACPSKHIDKADGYLEKLAYVPLEEIRADFQSRYRDIVRPLEGGQEDDRFEILFRGDPQDSFALMFFAFYELSAGFQLRALSRLYHASSAGRERPARKTGSIMMGADCLRVGRNEQAAGWFARAAAEQPGDYRPHVALGMLALEQGRPEQAAGHFRQALAFSLTAAQQGPVRLLLARAHETAGALGDARREMQRALADMADWHDGRYYLGALLAREGKLGMAFEIFTKLIRLNPRYYLMVALNPQLNAVQNEIFAFLNRELAAMRARARQSLAALQSLLDQRRAWFQEDDEDFKGARELYSKAAEIMNSESVAGLMDVPALEDTAAGMLKNALRHRQATVCKQAAAFGRHLAEHRGYLERYPYRSMLSERDEKDARAFAALLDASLREAERIPAPSPRDAAAMLERLARESAQLSARRTRLEWTRHLLFAGECGTKMTGVFAAVAGLTALCACGILLLYAGYESSFAELSPAQVEGFVRFGVFAGAVAGGTGSIVWVVRQYRNRQAKL